jgi:hypothetical protein
MGFKAIVIKAGIFSSIFSSMLVSHQVDQPVLVRTFPFPGKRTSIAALTTAAATEKRITYGMARCD